MFVFFPTNTFTQISSHFLMLLLTIHCVRRELHLVYYLSPESCNIKTSFTSATCLPSLPEEADLHEASSNRSALQHLELCIKVHSPHRKHFTTTILWYNSKHPERAINVLKWLCGVNTVYVCICFYVYTCG